jgi:cytochrome c
MRPNPALSKAMLCGLLLSTGALMFSPRAQAVDVEAAKTLAKQSNCFKCHAIEKKKEGPAWKEVAAKYKDKPLAESEARLITHITSGEKAKFEDGHEEDHAIVKSKDQAAIKNLVDFILSL